MNASTFILQMEVHVKLKVTALVVVFALAACLRAIAGTTGVMNGYVRDEDGQPAANALVTVVSPSETRETYTDKSGFFVFLTLPPDVYSVQVQKDGTSGAYAIGARINSDQTTFLTFRFNLYRRCSAFAPVTLAADRRAEQFESFNVQLMQAYPPKTAPPILLPWVRPARAFSCL